MKKIFLNINALLLTLILISSAFTIAVAQDFNADSEIRIKIEKEIDGEKQIIDKVFTDPNDPELKQLMGENNISINRNGKNIGSNNFNLNIKSNDSKSVEELKMKIKELADDLDIEIDINDAGNTQIFKFKGDKGQQFDFNTNEWSDDFSKALENLNFDKEKLNQQIEELNGSIKNLNFENIGPHNFNLAPNKAVMGVTIGDDENGVVIHSLQNNFGAKEAGLQEGDIIKAIDREKIETVDQVINYLEDKEEGDKVNVKYERNGKEAKVKVVLKERINSPQSFMYRGCDPSSAEDRSSIWKEFNANEIDNIIGNSINSNNFFKNENTRIMVMITDLNKSDNQQLENISPNANLKEMDDFEVEAIEFFPNPSKGIFNLKFSVTKATDTEINVYDVNGQNVYQKILLDFKGNFNENIDLDNPSSGTYILEVVRNNKRMNKKIVIQ